MVEQFYIKHIKIQGHTSQDSVKNEFPTWSTCLRAISFGWGEAEVDGSVDYYKEDQAYHFLLEVICGLHSPLLGETEVFGQFKKFLDENEKSFNQPLKKIFQQLLLDAKHIRSRYLSHLGSQSYGSLVRRYLRSMREVNVVGSGQLVQEMLPWLAKSKFYLRIHCRHPLKAKETFNFNLSLQIEDLSKTVMPPTESLVIAAPISNEALEKWMQSCQAQFKIIINLRSETLLSSYLRNRALKYYELNDLFNEIQQNKSAITEKVELAKSSIRSTTTQLQPAVIRPFGWDDL